MSRLCSCTAVCKVRTRRSKGPLTASKKRTSRCGKKARNSWRNLCSTLLVLGSCCINRNAISIARHFTALKASRPFPASPHLHRGFCKDADDLNKASQLIVRWLRGRTVRQGVAGTTMPLVSGHGQPQFLSFPPPCQSKEPLTSSGLPASDL